MYNEFMFTSTKSNFHYIHKMNAFILLVSFNFFFLQEPTCEKSKIINMNKDSEKYVFGLTA